MTRRDPTPSELIMMVAEMMDWRIAYPQPDSAGNIEGLALGTQEFLEDELLNVQDFEIMVSSAESQNEEEI